MLIAFVLHADISAGGDHAFSGRAASAPRSVFAGRRRSTMSCAAGVSRCSPGLRLWPSLGAVLVPRLSFDSDPLHTKNPNTEAMRTLYDLMNSPVTNPFTIDILSPNTTDAAALIGTAATFAAGLRRACRSTASCPRTRKQDCRRSRMPPSSRPDADADYKPAPPPTARKSVRPPTTRSKQLAPVLGKSRPIHSSRRIASDLRAARRRTRQDSISRSTRR